MRCKSLLHSVNYVLTKHLTDNFCNIVLVLFIRTIYKSPSQPKMKKIPSLKCFFFAISDWSNPFFFNIHNSHLSPMGQGRNYRTPPATILTLLLWPLLHSYIWSYRYFLFEFRYKSKILNCDVANRSDYQPHVVLGPRPLSDTNLLRSTKVLRETSRWADDIFVV